MRTRLEVALLGIVVTLFAVGCDERSDPAAPSKDSSASASNAASNAADASWAKEKIKFRSDAGDELYALKYRPDGAKLEAADGTEMVRLRTQENDRLKIKDKLDATVGYVAGRSPSWEVRDAEDTRVLYTLRKESDGNYLLAGSGVAFRFRNVSKGVDVDEVQNGQGTAAYLVRYDADEKRTSVREPSGKRLLVTKDDVDPTAMAVMGLEKLDLAHRVALFFKLQDEMGR